MTKTEYERYVTDLFGKVKVYTIGEGKKPRNIHCSKMGMFIRKYDLNLFNKLYEWEMSRLDEQQKQQEEEQKEKLDIDIYLDVDGVLFGRYKKYLHLRNGFLEFIDFFVENFKNVYWLTCWRESNLISLFSNIYGYRVTKDIVYKKWINNKTEAIDFNRNFIWIEDGITIEEKHILKKMEKLDSYIYVPFDGDLNCLYSVLDDLCKKYNLSY